MGRQSTAAVADASLHVLCCAVLQAFAKGAGPFLEAIQEHDFLHATKLTLMLAAIAVPLNTLFGTVAAILITRNEFPGKV
jgi:sulfate transport system permease protein